MSRTAAIRRTTKETDIDLKLSLDGGDLKVEGTISALIYDENRGRSRGGFLSRLLGG